MVFDQKICTPGLSAHPAKMGKHPFWFFLCAQMQKSDLRKERFIRFMSCFRDLRWQKMANEPYSLLLSQASATNDKTKVIEKPTRTTKDFSLGDCFLH